MQRNGRTCSKAALTALITNKTNKKHLKKNVGPIRHCEPPHAACFTLPFTRCRYCRNPPAHRCPQHQQRQRVTDGTAMAHRMGPIKSLVFLCKKRHACFISRPIRRTVETNSLHGLPRKSQIACGRSRSSILIRRDAIKCIRRRGLTGLSTALIMTERITEQQAACRRLSCSENGKD